MDEAQGLSVEVATEFVDMENNRDVLLDLLLSESDELLALMTKSLHALRASPSDREAMAELIRCAHAFKGLAVMASHPPIVDLAHRLEDALEGLPERASLGSDEALGRLEASVQTLHQLVRLAAGGGGDSFNGVARLTDRIERVGDARAARAPTVLVVDDSRTALRFVERTLSQAGYRVVTASTEAAAVDMIERERPALVLLDLSPAEQDGEALLGRLSASRTPGETPVVLFSSRAEDELREAARRGGAAGFLCKTRDEQELLARIRELLAGRDEESSGS